MTKTNDPDPCDVDLNAIFREAVERSGMSLYAIAKELGVNNSALTRPYKGERGISLEMLCRVAELAGLEVTIGLRKRRRSKG